MIVISRLFLFFRNMDRRTCRLILSLERHRRSVRLSFLLSRRLVSKCRPQSRIRLRQSWASPRSLSNRRYQSQDGRQDWKRRSRPRSTGLLQAARTRLAKVDKRLKTAPFDLERQKNRLLSHLTRLQRTRLNGWMAHERRRLKYGPRQSHQQQAWDRWSQPGCRCQKHQQRAIQASILLVNQPKNCQPQWLS